MLEHSYHIPFCLLLPSFALIDSTCPVFPHKSHFPGLRPHEEGLSLHKPHLSPGTVCKLDTVAQITPQCYTPGLGACIIPTPHVLHSYLWFPFSQLPAAGKGWMLRG